MIIEGRPLLALVNFSVPNSTCCWMKMEVPRLPLEGPSMPFLLRQILDLSMSLMCCESLPYWSGRPNVFYSYLQILKWTTEWTWGGGISCFQWIINWFRDWRAQSWWEWINFRNGQSLRSIWREYIHTMTVSDKLWWHLSIYIQSNIECSSCLVLIARDRTTVGLQHEWCTSWKTSISQCATGHWDH